MIKIGWRIQAIILLLFAYLSAGGQQPPELIAQSGHNDEINALAFSPDSKLLASGGDDSTVILWDVENERELRRLSGLKEQVKQVVFSPDGERLAGFSDLSRVIIVWDVRTGAALRTFTTGEQLIASISFLSNAHILAAEIHEEKEPGFWTKKVRRWSLESGKELQTITAGVEPLSGGIRLISPDGRFEAYGRLFEDVPIMLRSLPSGRVLHVLEGTYPVSGAIAFSPDSKTLAAQTTETNEQVVKLWSVSTGQVLDSYKIGSIYNSIGSINFSPNGKKLAIGISDITHWSGKILVWDLSTKKRPRQLAGASYQVNAIAVARDGKTIASVGNDKRVNFWDLATGLLRSSINAHPVTIESASFSPDGSTLVSSGGGQVKFWDVSTATEKPAPFELPHDVELVAFSPNGKILATAHEEYFDRNGNKIDSPIYARTVYQVCLWDFATGQLLLTIPTAAGKHAFGDVIAFSPDSKKIACASYIIDNPEGELPPVDNIKPVIRVWDIEERKEVQTLFGHKSTIEALAFGPDNKTLASSDFSNDRVIRLWDLNKPGRPRLLPDVGNVKALTFNQSGSMLVSGDWDNNVKIWDVRSGSVLKTLRHRSPVEAVAFSADEHVILSGGQDKKVTLWAVATGKELASVITLGQNDWQVERRNDWLVVTPDGLFDGSPAAWKQLIWRFDNNTFNYAPVEVYFKEFYYPGLLQEIMQSQAPKLPGRKFSAIDIRQPFVKITSIDNQRLDESAFDEASALSAPLDKREVGITIEVIENNKTKRQADHPAASGAQDVRLFRNGSLVKHWPNNVFASESGCAQVAMKPGEPRKAICKTTVTITAGENRFSAYAFNHEDVKSNDSTVLVSGAPALKREGTLYVLAIGINEYANKNFSLTYAVPDARDFSSELKARQEQLKQYGRTEVIPLYDAQATKQHILSTLADLAKKIEPEDALIVYFAGHGTVSSCQFVAAQANVRDRFYLVPYDLGYDGGMPTRCEQDMLSTITQNSISDEELERMFAGIDAGQLLLVIDACNSGQALESEEKRRGPMNSRGLAQLAYEKGMYILTAAQSLQAAKASKRLGHGYLTYALVEEGLKTMAADMNKDNQVVLREWLDYATQRVPQMQQAEGEQRLLVQAKAGSSSSSHISPDEIQHPRIFYRRELEARPLVIVKPTP